MTKIGRPRKEIDKELFEKLCELQCTEVEICGIFDVCEDTLNSWCKENYDMTFSDTFKKKSAKGKMSLRRLQYRIADNGNATMAIWLGKQWLGQTDKFDGILNYESTPQVNVKIIDNTELEKALYEDSNSL